MSSILWFLHVSVKKENGEIRVNFVILVHLDFRVNDLLLVSIILHFSVDLVHVFKRDVNCIVKVVILVSAKNANNIKDIIY